MPRFRRFKNRNVQEWKQDAVNIKAIGVPRAMVVKLAFFSELQELTLTSDTTGVRTYRLNSLFDPYQTGTGALPYGYSIWNRMYDEYMVLSVSVVAELQSIIDAYGNFIMWFSEEVPGVPSMPSMINNVGVQHKSYNSPGAGNRNIVRLKRKFNLPDYLGRELDPSRDSAASDSSPSQGAYLNLAWSNDSPSDADAVTIRVKMMFTARLFNLEELPDA